MRVKVPPIRGDVTPDLPTPNLCGLELALTCEGFGEL